MRKRSAVPENAGNVLLAATVILVIIGLVGFWWWRNHRPAEDGLSPAAGGTTIASPTTQVATPPRTIPKTPATTASPSLPTPAVFVVPFATGTPRLLPKDLIPWPESAVQRATTEQGNIVFAGLPRSLEAISTYTVLKNRYYWVGYSEIRRNPLWVAYHLEPERGQKPNKRPSYFQKDQRTKAQLSHGDYEATGYDRGHMAPNSAFGTRFGELGQDETFLMTNVCPQTPELNRKVWSKLERLEDDKYANTLGGVWIISGPIFDATPQFLPTKRRNDIEVPDAFFKIIIDETATEPRMQAFLVPQTVKGDEKPEEFLTSVDEIEKLARLDLFPTISDSREQWLEAGRWNKLWPVAKAKRHRGGEDVDEAPPPSPALATPPRPSGP